MPIEVGPGPLSEDEASPYRAATAVPSAAGSHCRRFFAANAFAILALPPPAALIGRAEACGRRRNADGMGRHGRGDLPTGTSQDIRTTMQRLRTRFLTAAVGAAMLFVGYPTFAQNAEQKAGDKDKPQASDAKEAQKKIDEFAEAERLLGGPAANPECLWLGRRVVSLLWRHIRPTPFPHLDLYDRSGGQAGHIQAPCRAIVRRGNIVRKAPDPPTSRAHGCWINANAETEATGYVPKGTTSR